ncbi:VOC family protein [Leptospira sarikeiensis]|uniref:VOC family protein n=1 Tax=Leptospira sarikeiensis TaxID=2484943 RepID=A0A4R9KBS2_9LEPT|nr:VOC family protein [Leptospira sarikeiensis]TGL63315.1 VOC family protein [Leptospira sarikeiensis]
MKITVTSVLVQDQEKAFQFYTKVLGFEKKTDIPMEGGRWLTLVSPEQRDGVELLLEPMGFAPAKDFQKSLLEAGIPWTSFSVDNVDKEFERLNELGVEFTMKPTQMGPVKLAVLNDTCGNLIQIAQLL